MDAKHRSIEIRPLSSGLGAEILNVDLSEDVSAQVFAEIQQAYHRFGVISFRDQQLSPEQHIAFARRWGEININRFFTPVDGYPMIAEVRKDPDQEANIGGDWHTDHSYDAVPAMGSILYAREVPALGGDTLFASMALAYQSLSPGLQKTLEGLQALHSSRHVFGEGRYEGDGGKSGRFRNPELAQQDALHPVVIRHPKTGQKLLYVNPVFTLRFEGWSEAESKPLLDYLYQQASRPEFTCRFEWRKGSLVFWDNLATWHYALNDYPGQCRVMHRITLEGSPI